MAKLVRRAKENPQLREYALTLVAGVPEKDFEAEVSEIFGFVRDSIRYTRDINGIETVQTPEKTLEYGQGDCDDQSVLLSALLEILGNQTRFIAVGRKRGQYSHVLVQAWSGREWVSLDPIMRVPVGWHPPGMAAVMTEVV